jgi:hypothetical protein
MGSTGSLPTLVLTDALPVIAAHHDPEQLAQWFADLLPPGWSQAGVIECVEHNELVPRFTMLERWLARYLNLPAPMSMPVAQWACQSSGATGSADEPWLLARWVHWQATRDHIVLQLAGREQFAPHLTERLVTLSQPSLAQHGWHAQRLSEQAEWVRLTPPSRQAFELIIRSSLVAQGRNIQAYLPEGDAARAWRSLHNELQMSWWADAWLQQQQSIGSRPINALWIEGLIDVPTLERWREASKNLDIRTDMPELMAALPATQNQSTPPSLAPSLDVRVLPADPAQLAGWWADHGAALAQTRWNRVVMLGQLHWVELKLKSQDRSAKPSGFVQALSSLTLRLRSVAGGSPAKAARPQGVLAWLR